ncbi:dicarboxylate/amino acid:cation symporter [Pseudoleptotrichia goodfellowii]|uniref:Transporter, dicarboxylate/amino acid:cation Na+/H+ symporter family protein n=1 Tax=Pseudoleptotrichia goodfellowii F0264 TaxID=596323 RepID=D0GNS5_9FUSO|nr:dicarboxylate/amino acid:cation symporter [Pseudoleptotrichia goodfellowii]EEY34265.1 transporter, dicarboxylate/amino acid:cation Na+/H+ symporter family protein [Pseudoleptotrichia goodfellowii F0264]
MEKSEINKKSFWKNYSFPILLLTGIAIGSIIGIILGEKATVLKPFGDIFINLMFTAVVPLVFITISSAVGSMINMKRLGMILGYMLLTFVVTGAIASIIIIIAVKIFPPAAGVNISIPTPEAVKPVSLGEQFVKAITVSDFSQLLSKSNMLPLIIFSVLFGTCVSLVDDEKKSIAAGLEKFSKVMMKLIELIMYYAPIGLGAYFAALIGEFGPQLLGSYAKAMIIYYPICIFYFFAAFSVYSFYAGGKNGVKVFFGNILNPSITSLATQSSIATLPVNLEAAKNMGVPKDIREIILPIGATMHMDGTCLSSILKISFLFGIFGKDFSGIGTYLIAIVVSVLGGVVMSGVPGGGLIGEMLIINLFGFPMEAFPIIATIGFLVDPPATWLNSTGDAVASMVVTRMIEGKNWIFGKKID